MEELVLGQRPCSARVFMCMLLEISGRRGPVAAQEAGNGTTGISPVAEEAVRHVTDSTSHGRGGQARGRRTGRVGWSQAVPRRPRRVVHSAEAKQQVDSDRQQ